MDHDTGRGSTRDGGRSPARLGASLASLLLACATARADAPSVSPEDPFFLELPVVLSATRLAQRPQDAPAAVFVIDREMIEASGAREIADLLRLAPGFVVASDGGHQRAVGYHGFIDEFGRRLQVLVDGRSVYTPFYGGLAWSDLPLAIDDIERIEVIRGPNSATHGANAFTGVVNIYSRPPDASQGLYARLAGGDPDYFQGVFRHGFTRGPLEVRYTLGHEEDDGFTEEPVREILDSKDLDLATFDAVLRADANDRFRLQAGIKTGDLETGSFDAKTLEPDVDNPPRSYDVTHTFGQLSWERELEGDQQVRVTAYAERLDLDDDISALLGPNDPDNPFPPAFGISIDTDFRYSRTEERYAIELQHLLHPTDDLRLVWGAELREDEVDAPGLFGPGNPVDDTMTRLFANAEWRFAKRWTANAGLMLEDHDLSDGDTSPRLAVNYTPNDRHSFRLSASRSVRTPSMREARSDQYFALDLDLTGLGGPGIDGNPDLIYQVAKQDGVPDNETVEAYEFGWLFDLSATLPVRGDVKVFYERYEGLLVENTYPFLTRSDLAFCDPALNPVVGLVGSCNANPGNSNIDEPADAVSWSFSNQVDVDLYGIEASLEVRPSARSRVVGSYSLTEMRNQKFTRPELLDYPYNDGRSTPSRLADYEDQLSKAVPTHIFNLLGILKPTPDTTLSAALYHVSDMHFLETGDDLDSFTRLDLRAARRFRLDAGWQAELYGVAQNVGQKYSDFEGKNLFDTRLFVGLRLHQ